jgi:hypothetical protein
MTHHLWAIETSNQFGQLTDEVEVLALIRALVDAYGPAYADELGLGRVTDAGEILEPLTGAALIARVNDVFPERPIAPARQGAAIA